MANTRDFVSQFQGLTLENVGSWPFAPRAAVWFAVILICAVLGWFVLWSKQVDELDGLRAEEVTYRPLADVRDEIYTGLKNDKAKVLLDRLDQETTVKILNPAFAGK